MCPPCPLRLRVLCVLRGKNSKCVLRGKPFYGGLCPPQSAFLCGDRVALNGLLAIVQIQDLVFRYPYLELPINNLDVDGVLIQGAGILIVALNEFL